MAAAVLFGVLAIAVLWLAFAGSAARLADGVSIAGVDVSGMTPAQARVELERRAAAVAATPVVFAAGDRTWQLTPRQLGLAVDWAAAVEAARREGDGFGPLRGYRRLQTRVFGADIAPPVRVYDAALRYHVQRLAAAVAQQPREAAIELRGLRPLLVPARTGHALDRAAAEATIVRSLAGLDRTPVGLPVRVDTPTVTTAELRPVVAKVKLALSAPVRLSLGETRWRLPRWRIAQLLALPSHGAATLAIGGPAAEEWLRGLAARVDRPPADARFTGNADGSASVIPARPGLELDHAATATALLEAATSRTRRLAAVVVAESQPEFTSAEAEALGVTRVLSSYSTFYAGSADRITNLRLAVQLLDGARIAPGATFSFNDRVGERTLERGFRPAPVIVGDKYEEDVGGGVSQVATTVFNAAWEAGLPISGAQPARAVHRALPARPGRDGELPEPRPEVRQRHRPTGSCSARAPAATASTSASTAATPAAASRASRASFASRASRARRSRRTRRALVGEREVLFGGEPSRAVSVQRIVYDRDGTVLRRETWSTSYRSEAAQVRVGTKPKPPPEKPKPADEKPTTTTPDPAVTTPAEQPPTTTTGTQPR